MLAAAGASGDRVLTSILNAFKLQHVLCLVNGPSFAGPVFSRSRDVTQPVAVTDWQRDVELEIPTGRLGPVTYLTF